tara:strand:+ start:11548 stop:12054 length:507 start_codon:yes stop_codon:yes gene_type:complete
MSKPEDLARLKAERDAVVNFFGNTFSHAQTIDNNRVEQSVGTPDVSDQVKSGLQDFISRTKRVPAGTNLSPSTEELAKQMPTGGHADAIPASEAPVPPPPSAPQNIEPPISVSQHFTPPATDNTTPPQMSFDFGNEKGLTALHEKYDKIISNQTKMLAILNSIADSKG